MVTKIKDIFNSNITLPNTVMLVGYGAIGKCFTEMLLDSHPNANLIVVDIFDHYDARFKYMKFKVTRENLKDLLKNLEKGDIYVDLSIGIDFLDAWKACINLGIMYLCTATEDWADTEDEFCAFPESMDQMYETSIAWQHDQIEEMPQWNRNNGTTCVIEHGMNPGLISHFSKKGLTDAAQFFLQHKKNPIYSDLDFELIEKYLNEKNYPKLAQACGLLTIHCSEIDNQWINPAPKDCKTKFYNTWSCQGMFTEAFIPIQIAKGSHEDKVNEEFPRVKDDRFIMSWKPAYWYRGKSWLPNENIEGFLIPHGESVSISKFFKDPETGYCPSQYFVYGANPYSKEFFENLKSDTTLETCDPEFQVIDPAKYELHGYDKVGALLIFKNNRGWWSGTIMDEHDASLLFDHKFGPTSLQVSAGCYAGFLWMCNNLNAGCKWPERIDTDFILEASKKYLGRIYSKFVDLTKTDLKDCTKFEQFITRKLK